MTIYTNSTGLSNGLVLAVNHALLQLTKPELGMLQALMDGSPKVLITNWNGDPHGKDLDETFSPTRGDGKLRLLKPGDTGYQVPVNFRADDPSWNIRAAVPLWVLGCRRDGDGWMTLGVGAVHPALSSATVDFYCPSAAGQQVTRIYFADPRTDLENPGEHDLPLEEQWERIEDAGGDLPAGARRAPAFAARHIP